MELSIYDPGIGRTTKFNIRILPRCDHKVNIEVAHFLLLKIGTKATTEYNDQLQNRWNFYRKF